MTADEPSLERQMGCMAGFFHIFDRNFIPSKRYLSPKNLLAPSDTESISPSEKSDASSTFHAEKSPNLTHSLKETTPWKLLEASRLSLDSRAVTDAKGKLHRRSPGAVARLMGLDALPDKHTPDIQCKPAMLRRSSSESRARLDPPFYQFVDATAFERAPFNENSRKQNNSAVQRKSFELFPPERKRVGTLQPVPVSLYCEIERGLRVRGIKEPARDLETLKQVLEAVQMRGLLHSKQFDGPRKSIDDHDHYSSPLVLMKPASKLSRAQMRDLRSEKRAPQAVRCTDRSRRVVKSEIRRVAERNISPVRSPVGSPKKVAPDPGMVRSGVNNRRRDANVVQRRKFTGTGTGSENRIKSLSQFDWEEEKTGRNILERCDKLLYSIAAITATDQISSDLQPSPVSVLDSVFHGEECSPSPKTKRSLQFQDQVFDWAHKQSNDEMPAVGCKCRDPDYIFVADIMRYYNQCQDSTKLLALLEKHRKLSRAGSSSFHRHLLYDLVFEILNQHRNMPSWEAFRFARSTSFTKFSQMPDIGIVWQQIQQMRDPIISNEVADVTSRVISKDMAADHTWSYRSVELSDTVLHIERMIFKDLVTDTIQEFSDVPSYHLPRRKLIF